MNKTILVIEDEPEIRKDIVKTLELSKYNTLSGENGLEGLKLARLHVPDLIISDIMMPELDGFELLRELQTSPDTASIPFLFLSAKSAKNDIREAMKLGADDFITKPFDIDELLNAVEIRLKKKETQEQHYNRRFEELRTSLRRSIPHEIRTPLNIILGFSEFLEKDYKKIPYEDAKEMLSNIFEAGRRLHHLFENYLIYANLEIIATNPTEIKNLSNKKAALPEYIIRDTVSKTLYKSVRTNDITLDLDDAPIAISEDYLSKIVEELLDNSLKFSDKGTKITVMSAMEKNYYMISFSDFGRGMTKEQISNIGAYVQFERKIYEQQGTGLGIAIVKRITELHNGIFQIDSEPNRFTTVTVKIPLYGK